MHKIRYNYEHLLYKLEISRFLDHSRPRNKSLDHFSVAHFSAEICDPYHASVVTSPGSFLDLPLKHLYFRRKKAGVR